MAIFKKKDKNKLPGKLSNHNVEYSDKSKKEEKKAKNKKIAKVEKKQRIRKFFKSMFAEMKKVSWPTWKKTLIQTGIVIAVVLIFTVIILAVDLFFAELLSLITRGKNFNPIQPPVQ